MTERLYYHDARLTDFDARVARISDDGLRIVLDRTAFYPTSGGQPHDTGVLGAAQIIDVIDEDDHIVHFLDRPLDAGIGDTLHGIVDRERRFDHMQQHTGQHLLSALLADRYASPTVSVHFGAHYSTVDVTASNTLVDESLVDVERVANDIIAANVPVTVSFEDARQATALRKPSDRDGELRIVSIEGIDRSACGGTHVSRTGEIGGMLLRRVERTKGQLRIEFLCGQRAVRAARSDYTTLQSASRLLSAAPAELPSLVEGLQLRVKELERAQRRLEEELADYKGREIWQAHETRDGIRRIHLPFTDGQARDRQSLAVAITKHGHTIVLVTASSSNSLLLATAENSGVDAGREMKELMARFGGRGGGSPRVAQGSVSTPTALDAIVNVLQCTAR